MTLDESIQLQMRLQSQIDPNLTWVSQPHTPLLESFRLANQLAASGVFHTIQQQDFLWKQLSPHTSLWHSIEQAVTIANQMPPDLLAAKMSISSYDLATSALRAAAPYIPSEFQPAYEDECKKFKADAPVQKPSVDTIINIINLLVAVLALILPMMSPSQVDDLEQQNDQLIALERQQLEELQEQNDALRRQNELLQENIDAAQALHDTAVGILEGIQVMSQELQVLREKTEALSDDVYPDR